MKLAEQLIILKLRIREKADSIDAEGTVKNVGSSIVKAAVVAIDIDLYSKAEGNFRVEGDTPILDVKPGETRQFLSGTYKYDTSGNPARVRGYLIYVRRPV